MNRLRLDWDLQTSKERTQFLDTYLKDLNITLTKDELDMCGTYVLWGKDPDGKNSDQRHEIELPRRNKRWGRANEKAEKTSSLNELLENPNFNENELQPLNEVPRRHKTEPFSREKARKEAPTLILKELEKLWNEIDFLELLVAFYDLRSGKRKNPPRDSLLLNLSVEEIDEAQKLSEKLTPAAYLKRRHLLIELRSQQFLLKDSYSSGPILSTPAPRIPRDRSEFGSDFPVFPFGLLQDFPIFFQDFRDIGKLHFQEKDLRHLGRILWAFRDQRKKIKGENLSQGEEEIEEETYNAGRKFIPYFDFTDPDHVTVLLTNYIEIQDDFQSHPSLIRSEDRSLFPTLKFYIKNAKLSDIQREILQLKMGKTPNLQIAGVINQKYGKNYTDNYISTIFRQKIIPSICEAAELHFHILENLFFPENFKPCIKCGRPLLCDSNFFVRRARSKDGFANKCKECDREEREYQKILYKNLKKEEKTK